MAESIHSETSSVTRSAATGNTNLSAQLWAAEIRQLGVVDVTYDDVWVDSAQPWSVVSDRPSHIFGVDADLYDQVKRTIGNGEDPGPTPVDDALAGFRSLPSSCLSCLPPSSRELWVLSNFRYAVARIRHLRRLNTEESLWQSHMESMIKALVTKEWLHAEHTNTQLHSDVSDRFGLLIRVKPDLAVGLLMGRIDFRQGDVTMEPGVPVEIYAASRGVLYNLNQLPSCPWFPHLICEIKSFQRSPGEVEKQTVIGMYYALNILVELAERAKQADPMTYARRPMDQMLGRVYGLAIVGEYWSLWMLSQGHPMLLLDHGLGRNAADMKRLFLHLDRIDAEAQPRIHSIGLWLFCLRNISRGVKRARVMVKVGQDDDNDVEDNLQVTPKQTRRVPKSDSAHRDRAMGEGKRAGTSRTRERPQAIVAEPEGELGGLFRLVHHPLKSKSRSAASVSARAKVVDWLSCSSDSASSASSSGSGNEASRANSRASPSCGVEACADIVLGPGWGQTLVVTPIRSISADESMFWAGTCVETCTDAREPTAGKEM